MQSSKEQQGEKDFLSDQCKEIQKTIEWERQDFFKKLEIPREHFTQRQAQ